MEPFKLGTTWNEVKEKIKELNIDITDEDLAYQPGKEDEFLSRLQEKMKSSKEDIRGIIESVLPTRARQDNKWNELL